MTPENGCVIDGIPNEWETKRLHQVAEIRSGVAKNSNIEVSDPISVHYLRVANVQDGYLDLSEMSKIKISRSNLTRFAVLPGDVLMNEGGDLDQLGRGALWQGQYSPCVHQNHVFVVRCGRSVTAEFLSHWTGSETAKSYFLVGGKQTTNLASINKTALGLLPVAVPPPDEQRAIAEALSDVDALLGVLDRMLTKKRDLKQAAMQQLLTGQTRLPGFKDEWAETQIGPHIDLLTGYPFPSSKYAESGIRLLRGSNVKRGETDWSDDLIQCWPEITPSIRQFELQAGDLVIAMDGSLVGRSYARLCESDLPALLLQRVARLRSSAIDIGYLTQHVGSEYFIKYCDSVKTVTAIPHISPSDIRNFRVPLPPTMAEQTAIAEVLSDMDAEIAALERRREKTQDLKQGMMQELLTGKTRLI